MGKASSSKKVSRAAKAAGRPGARKNYGWPMTIGAVVLLGIVLIVLTVSSNEDRVDAGDTGPPSFLNNDHWHAAYGIYDCDSFLAPLEDVSASDPGGLHTHADGLMHIHPFLTRTSGDGANIGNFGEQVGLRVTDDSFEAGSAERKTGDKCGGKTGQVELVTWSSPDDATPTVVRKDIADYDPDDGSVWVLAFVPEGTEVPKPPSIANLADPTAAEEGRQPATATTAPSTPESSTSTSAPASETSSTSTSAP